MIKVKGKENFLTFDHDHQITKSPSKHSPSMQTLDLHHHDAGGTSFKLDQVPSDVIANFFGFLPTLDLGRMMVVCRGFNQILSINPSLWRIVELDKATPNKKALRIIKVFAARSRNTLQSLKTPAYLEHEEMSELAALLNESKATLRRLDMRFEPQEDAAKEDINFFKSFPVIERLNLTTLDLPDAERIPGVLTMMAWNWVGASNDWDEEVLGKISSVTTLYLDHETGFDNLGSLHHILNACASSLVNLMLMCGCREFTPLQIDLPNLSSLTLAPYGSFENFFTRPMPNLKHLEGSPMILGNLNLRNLQSINFKLEENWGGEVDESYDCVIKMMKLIKDSSSTLTFMKIKTGKEEGFCIHPVLRMFRVDYLSPLCPLLSDLYITTEHELSLDLLAEVLVSRNFASQGWKLEGEEGEPERSCSKGVIHLEASHVEAFRSAEKEVLSRIPEWISRQAGKTEIKEWDGK